MTTPSTLGEKTSGKKMHNGEITLGDTRSAELMARLRSIQLEMLPQYGGAWPIHSISTLPRSGLTRIMYYAEIYKKIIDVPGVICEFGVQWGATLSLLKSLWSLYEPSNASRKIFGFDTFSGFSEVDAKDGKWPNIGDYKSLPGYEERLEEILSIHEELGPLNGMKKFELIKGDASVTIDAWLDKNPHAIISMAIFDMDVYTPTKNVLQKIIPRLVKGSLLVFDELNCEFFPGETAAVQEVLGLNNLRLKRYPYQNYGAWAVFGE